MPAPNKYQEIKNILQQSEIFKDLFRFNLMTHDIEFIMKAALDNWNHGKILTDDDLLHIKDFLSETTGKEYDKRKIEEAVIIASKARTIHPVKNYLNLLKWDGEERLPYWLTYVCGAKLTSYTRAVGVKIICGAVARMLDPGCKFDYMLILEGDQGLGKSTLVETLGGEWYVSTNISGPDKKDIVDIMRTAWIIEIADMAGFNKADIQHLKSFIDRKVDRVRLPYDRRVKDFPRQCILVGTHNPSGDNEYFKDDTGNRRFWPVECKNIHIDRMKETRDQLFAEAIVRYRSGEKLYINDKEALDLLENIHQEREIKNPYEKMLSNLVAIKDTVTIDELLKGLFNFDVKNMNYRELRGKQTMIGIWLKKNKWIKDGDVYKRKEEDASALETVK